MKFISTLLFTLICTLSHAQKTEVAGQQVERIFRSQDSTQNFYLVLAPKLKPKGLLVILPGFGTQPGGFLEESDLPAKAREDGYLVVIPSLAINTYYSDSLSQSRLRTLIPEVIQKYRLPKDKFAIGGHSIGGNGAMLYAEYAIKENGNAVKPNLVFGVDPPLDMKRLFNTCQYIKNINFRQASVDEASYFIEAFRKQYGGTPLEKPAAYEAISSYYRDAKNGGNASYLRSTPVRLYCDPDIQWYIENRRQPYEHLNAADLSACIVQLRLLGNDKAELITNIGKGYFRGGVRHPHGFTSLESKEFLQWMNLCLYP